VVSQEPARLWTEYVEGRTARSKVVDGEGEQGLERVLKASSRFVEKDPKKENLRRVSSRGVG